MSEASMRDIVAAIKDEFDGDFDISLEALLFDDPDVIDDDDDWN